MFKFVFTLNAEGRTMVLPAKLGHFHFESDPPRLFTMRHSSLFYNTTPVARLKVVIQLPKRFEIIQHG